MTYYPLKITTKYLQPSLINPPLLLTLKQVPNRIHDSRLQPNILPILPNDLTTPATIPFRRGNTIWRQLSQNTLDNPIMQFGKVLPNNINHHLWRDSAAHKQNPFYGLLWA